MWAWVTLLFPGRCLIQLHLSARQEALSTSLSRLQSEGIMVRECAIPECGTHARFNHPGESHGVYCSKHKVDGMRSASPLCLMAWHAWPRALLDSVEPLLHPGQLFGYQ